VFDECVATIQGNRVRGPRRIDATEDLFEGQVVLVVVNDLADVVTRRGEGLGTAPALVAPSVPHVAVISTRNHSSSASFKARDQSLSCCQSGTPLATTATPPPARKRSWRR